MAIPKILGAQRDFSAGEVDVALKRSDENPVFKAGARQMANWRILNSRKAQNRPGKSALFPAAGVGRTEEITMSPGNTFKIMFGWRGNGEIQIFNSSGIRVADIGAQGSGAPLPWVLANVNQIVYAVFGLSIYITFPGMKPQVLSWDGVSIWSMADYTELTIGSQKRTLFYRFAPPGVTIVASAQTGAVIVNASQAIFTLAHIGTRIRYINRQLLITNVVGPFPSTVCAATVEEALPGHQTLTFATDPSLIFSVGDVVRGTASGSVGQIFQIVGTPTNALTIQLLNTNSSAVATLSRFPSSDPGGALAFTSADTIVGQGGSISGGSPGTIGVPAPTTIWDEEMMNPMRGYPSSCFVDNFRLGFCNFPALPEGIAWSAINSATDLYVGGPTVPNGAIFEVAPDKVQILYVVPGPESSEFVFCDHKIYYIKIDSSNPLVPGSVRFQLLSGDGAAQVQPRIAQDVIFFVKAGGNSVMAVTAPGAYYRPFNTKNLCEFHSHLFKNVVALAAPNADGTFLERYIYALNSNGSMACGKYSVKDGQIADEVGWGPWTGSGAIAWIAAQNADVLFTTSYFGQTICEILDDTSYLDGSVFVNNLPATFTPPSGKGPLWWLAGQTVTLMDQTTRVLGTYQVDVNGNIVPQNNAGENLAVSTLVAGQPWTATLEPFAPDANPGTSIHQRMFKRRIARMAVAVGNSTGFLLARLFSGPLTRTSPALGTIMNQRRITAYNQDDDPTLPPPLREEVQRWRPLGRAFDPRVAIIKDVPGPLLILEIGIEVSI